jgi:PAN domain
MRIRSILTLPILALVLAVNPPDQFSLAHAARITAPGLHVKAVQANDKTSAYWPADPVLCDLILEGDVEEGDAASLEQKFQTIVGSFNSFSFFLCLRSPGGDLREAVKIAQFVLRTQRPSIATVIEDGQTCASACAVIFLAGNAPARVGAWPQRFLHPRGKLLYHSSRLDLSKFADKELLALLTEPTDDPRGLKGKIVDLYRDGLRDVQSVIATFQNFTFQREDLGDRWVRPSLFLEMFAQDPDEWICVDNVDAVGRWNVQVFGYQPPSPPKKQHYSNVCRSAYHWRSDQFVVGAEDDLEEEGELKTPSSSTTLGGRNRNSVDFNERFTMSFQAPMQPLTCVVEVKYFGYDTKRKLDVESTLTAFFTPGAGAISQLAPTAYFPASTLLRDLPGIRPAPERAAIRTRPAADFGDYPNSVMNGCSYKSIPKTERAACQVACSADPTCKAYSHNKISQACELKHTLTARRLDPMWTSGAPSAGPAPGRSVRIDGMVLYQVPGRNMRLEGKLIDASKVESQEVCSDRCKSDRSCLALEHDPSAEVCRRFSDVTGLREAPTDSNFVSIETKRQR